MCLTSGFEFHVVSPNLNGRRLGRSVRLGFGTSAIASDITACGKSNFILQMYAEHSISTSVPNGRALTDTHVRT